MLTLITVFDKSQFESWIESPLFSPDATVFTSDLWVASEANRRKIPFIETCSFLNSQVTEKTLLESRRLAQEWWKPILGRTQYRNVLLADAMAMDLWYALNAAIHLHRMLNSLLSNRRFESVVIFNRFEEPIFWDPPPGPRSDILNAVALWTAQRLGYQPIELTLSGRAKSPVLPTVAPPLKDIYRRQTCILTWMNASSLRRRVLHFARAVEESRYSHVVIQREEDPVYANFKNTVSTLALRKTLSPPLKLFEELADCRKRFLNSADSSTHSYPFIFDNPYFQFQFDAFWNNLEEGAREIEVANYLFQTLSPKACISEWAADGMAKCRQRIAKVQSVTTLSLHHGGASQSIYEFEALDSEADLLLVEGDINKEGFEKIGRNPSSILSIGPLTLDSPTPKPESNSILLLTSMIANGLAAPGVNECTFRQDWEELLSMIRQNPTWNFLHKSHPEYDYFDFYDSFEAPPNLKKMNEPIEAGISQASLAIMFNTHTSAGIQAMRAGVPVIYFKRAVYTSGKMQPSVDCEEVSAVSSIGELQAVMMQLWNASPRKAVIAQERKFLRRFFATASSLEALAKFLRILDNIPSRRFRTPARARIHTLLQKSIVGSRLTRYFSNRV